MLPLNRFKHTYLRSIEPGHDRNPVLVMPKVEVRDRGQAPILANAYVAAAVGVLELVPDPGQGLSVYLLNSLASTADSDNANSNGNSDGNRRRQHKRRNSGHSFIYIEGTLTVPFANNRAFHSIDLTVAFA